MEVVLVYWLSRPFLAVRNSVGKENVLKKARSSLMNNGTADLLNAIYLA